MFFEEEHTVVNIAIGFVRKRIEKSQIFTWRWDVKISKIS